MNYSVNCTTPYTTVFDLSDIHLALLEKRATVVNGSVVIEKTGEIIGEYTHSQYEPEPYDYSTWIRNEPIRHVEDDDEGTMAFVTGTPTTAIKGAIKSDVVTADHMQLSVEPTRNPKGAGRKPKSTVNPIAHIVAELVSKPRGQEALPGRPRWLDDILFGSCLAAAGQSQNVCNVEMNAVLAALHMKKFEVQAVMAGGVAKRKAQLIIQAARHAAEGIHHYLLRHPDLLKGYEEAAKIEVKYAYSHVALVPFTPPMAVPQHITDLYLNGDYVAYGEALRAFRRPVDQTQSEAA
ncbi:hypothetical protein NG726_25085 [Pseudomonas sp. MOB-449]|nr:hypothetical protein [Pseudomonas sp. MOB-449]